MEEDENEEEAEDDAQEDALAQQAPSPAKLGAKGKGKKAAGKAAWVGVAARTEAGDKFYVKAKVCVCVLVVVGGWGPLVEGQQGDHGAGCTRVLPGQRA